MRLPSPIGATVSILGGLVVGNAAVEAHIVSPAVLIAVAIAGVAGYTMPSQDFASALRLWRFLLAIAASIGGYSAWRRGVPPSSTTWRGWRPFWGAPIWLPSPTERDSPGAIPACCVCLCPG